MRPVVLLHAELSPGATVTFYRDPSRAHYGIHPPGAPNLVQLHATKREREDIACWVAIQKERKRLGLTPLLEESMPVG